MATDTETGLINGALAGSLMQREKFGATEIQTLHETASTAVAAREKAAVEAKYIVAMRRPRSLQKARQDLLQACGQKGFAESAWYKIPNRGEGFTIRFAEEALRCFGNVLPQTSIVFESTHVRMFRVSVTDLESNISYESEVIIQKTVERKQPKAGTPVVGERLNSAGEKVFLVEATEEEITVKQNSALSKALRTSGLRLIPSWIKEEARVAIFAAKAGAVKDDLAGTRRKLADSFLREFGISVGHLEQYLRKPLEQATAEDVVDLRDVYTALRDGESKWADVMEARAEQQQVPTPEEKHGSAAAAQRVAADKLRQMEPAEDGARVHVNEDQPLKAAEPSEPEQKTKTSAFNFGGKR